MYAKIFRQIYESSIAENPQLRYTFMDLLVLADSDGVVDMTQESIARITKRPLKVIRETIAELESPDPRSRTPDHDGARLKRLDDHRDWGWVIVNYHTFRATASEDQRREKTRERVRRFRQKTNEKPLSEACNAPVTHGNAGNAMQKQREKDKEKHNQKEKEVPFVFSASEKAVERPTNPAVSAAFESFHTKLAGMFGREAGQALPYEDQCELLTITARPHAAKELELIIAFRSRAERFPESVSGLLKSWDKTVDRARNWKPKRDESRPAYYEDNTIEAEMIAARKRIARI